ncbi:MAG: glucan 1,4-alpha-glucosidase [Candidatus Abyssubacteria bacterium]
MINPSNRIPFGHPGIPPKWTSSSKEGIGTANSAASRVWFTLSHGIVNEVYYPTIDHPQIRDLQLLITDGETFLHEEKRDLRSEIQYIERDTLGYRVVSADPNGRYRIVKEIIADPCQPCVLIHARLEGERSMLERLQVYALLAPHIEVGGWGNSAQSYRVAGNMVLIAWKSQTYLAMGANVGFLRTSCGYVGASDGWQDLKNNYRMDWEFERAEDGNIAVTGQIDISKTAEFTLGLAFGQGRHDAVCTLMQSLSMPFNIHKAEYIEQWRRVGCDILDLSKPSGDGGRLYRVSHNLLLAHEDKTFAGALIASASIPWGQSKGDEDLGGYHLVWTRDMVNSATGLLACGDTVTPRRALVYLACSQRADGGFPQNFWIDGTPYWGGIQLDEVAFPVMLAWRLWKADALGDFDPYPTVKRAAAYLIRQGPMTQQERWEENSGYSPSTLAACIAALICAADFCKAREENAAGLFLEEYADFLESHIEDWTVTTEGTLVQGISRHYIRIHPTDINDPSPDENPNAGMLALRNRPPGEPWEFRAKEIVDAGFLELVRYGIRRPGDTLVEDSLKVVDSVLKVETPCGPCWRRYNGDGYGERPDGGPYEGWGKGRAWPLLTGERGHYELAKGSGVELFIRAIERFASRGGMIPEQVWDEPDKPEAGMFLGRFAGSAMPLMWAHAEYIKLLRSATDGRVFDMIDIVADRYWTRKGRNDLEVWKPVRQVRSVRRGHILRVQAPAPFLLHWTADEWSSVNETTATPSGLEIYFVDIPVGHNQCAPIRFTFYWFQTEKWEGRDYRVMVK